MSAIAGLLGGLSKGLNDWMGFRETQSQMDNRAKLTAIQEQQELRQKQAQEFENRKAQYLALNPETDLTEQEVQPFVASGFKFVKGQNGFRRPFSVEEQADSAQRKLAELGITDKELQAKGWEFIAQNPNMPQDQLSRLVAQFRLPANSVAPTMQDVRDKAAIELDADREIEQIRAAARLAEAREISNRPNAAALNIQVKDNDPAYLMWKRSYMRNPGEAEAYNQAVQQFGAAHADSVLKKEYVQSIQPMRYGQ
jgi:hypothetical protein